MAITETIYIERDNKNELILKQDDVAQDISALTKVQITDKVGNVLASATVSDPDGVFDWTTDGATGKLVMKLGETLTHKRTYNDARLVVYDIANTLGIVWVDNLVLVVK